jgi:hypothetical protein
LLFLSAFPICFGGTTLGELWFGVGSSGMTERQLAGVGYTSIGVLVAIWAAVLLSLRRVPRVFVLNREGLIVRYHARSGQRVFPRDSLESLTEDLTRALPTWRLSTARGTVKLDHMVDGVVQLVAKLAAMAPNAALSWEPHCSSNSVGGSFEYDGPRMVFRNRFPFTALLVTPFLIAPCAIWSQGLPMACRGDWKEVAAGLGGAIGFTLVVAGMLVAYWPQLERWRRQVFEVTADGVYVTDAKGRRAHHRWSDILFVGEVRSGGGDWERYKVLSRQGSFELYRFHLRNCNQLVEVLQRAAQTNRGTAASRRRG